MRAGLDTGSASFHRWPVKSCLTPRSLARRLPKVSALPSAPPHHAIHLPENQRFRNEILGLATKPPYMLSIHDRPVNMDG